jgi:hypothetical protein
MCNAADQTEEEEGNHFRRSRPVNSSMVTGECRRLTIFAGTPVHLRNGHDSSRFWALGLDERGRITSPTIFMSFFNLAIR